MPPQETKQKHPFNLSDEKAERLAAATLEFCHWFIEQPGGREKLEARKAELRKHYKTMYEGLLYGDPKMRVLRILWTEIYNDHNMMIKEAQRGKQQH